MCKKRRVFITFPLRHVQIKAFLAILEERFAGKPTHSYIYRKFSEFLLVFLIIKAVTINSYKKIIFSQQLDKDNEFLTLATCLFKELDEICH